MEKIYHIYAFINFNTKYTFCIQYLNINLSNITVLKIESLLVTVGCNDERSDVLNPSAMITVILYNFKINP